MSDMTEAKAAYADPDRAMLAETRAMSPYDEAFGRAQEAEAELGSVIAILTDRLGDFLRPTDDPGDVMHDPVPMDPRAYAVSRMDGHAAAIRSQTARLRRVLGLLDL